MYYLRSRYYHPTWGRFINADCVFEGNLFAYCLNNSLAFIDADGYRAVPLVAFGIEKFSHYLSQCGDLTTLITALFAEVSDRIVSVKEAVEKRKDIAKNIVDMAERTNIDSKKTYDNSIYLLINSKDEVRYVGRTNCVERRLREHQHNFLHPERMNYTMKVVATGLSKEQAIFGEQLLISAYSMEYLENARREIAVGKIGKFIYNIEAAAEILKFDESMLLNLLLIK